MGRLSKEINGNVLTENDLMSLAKWHTVCVYGKENFKNYESIAFKCSQYRKLTKCQYQLKAKLYHDDKACKIFYSQYHEHGLLENTSLQIETYSVIRGLGLNGLTISQIRKTMCVTF